LSDVETQSPKNMGNGGGGTEAGGWGPWATNEVGERTTKKKGGGGGDWKKRSKGIRHSAKFDTMPA